MFPCVSAVPQSASDRYSDHDLVMILTYVSVQLLLPAVYALLLNAREDLK